MFSTPKLPFKKTEYKYFYEPAEDSFVVLDGFEKDFEMLKKFDPSAALEIGPGSGISITFLARLFPACFCVGVDINEKACQATTKTAAFNNVTVECVRGDLSLCFRKASFDIILFNPPYVLTGDDELGRRDITAAWAGGLDGRGVIDRILEVVDQYLAANGFFYLITVRENNLQDIRERMALKGFKADLVLYRVAGWEGLSLTRFQLVSKTTFA
jgi:release factor glutamine methyltransferase